MENVTAPSQTPPETKRFDLYQTVTNIIIQQLEAGTIPWKKPWNGHNGCFKLPQNASNGNTYRGINIILLWGASLQKGYQSSEWATMKQWNKQKESIRAKEKGSIIVYYDTLEKEVDGEIKKIPFLKYSTMFNKAQLASYDPDSETDTIAKKPLFDRLSHVDAFVANTKAIIEHGPNRAFYSPGSDTITMPHPGTFIDYENCSAQEGYYSVLMHELVHYSGHPKRLNREFGKKFGDRKYAIEELTAELGAAFLCASLEITTPQRKDHAAYIANWLKVLRDNKQFIFSAASEASKAVDYFKSLQTE
jgi:antirestriction protein ArdC